MVREVTEFTIRLESTEQFHRLYNYFKGRTLVHISDWKYENGFYVVRNHKLVEQETLVLTVDYFGKEITEQSDANPVDFNYRVLVEEDFSNTTTWPVAAITWPKTSAGIGQQYGDVSWDARGTATNWSITSQIRPGGSTAGVLTCTQSRDIIMESMNEYSCYEVRAVFATNSANEGPGITFKIQDWKGGVTPKTGLILFADGAELVLYRYRGEGLSPVEVKRFVIPTTRPTFSTLSASDYYELKVRVYGPVMEFYYNGKFVETFKWDWHKSGAVGIKNYDTATMYCSDFVFKRIPMRANVLPVGAYNVSEFIEDASYTKDGWVQRAINPYEPVKYFMKEANKGLVRVWDMKDGDFKTPYRWEEVTSDRHIFLGDMFVENGIAGLWYTGGQLFYMYHEHLKDVLVGFDTSAWWSQGYSLQNVTPFKTSLSPSAMTGSLFKQYRWKDPFWFLNARDKWLQSRTHNFNLLATPELEVDFFIQSWLADGTYDSGSRIASYNKTNVREGVHLSAPAKKLKGGIGESASVESTFEGNTTLISGAPYNGKFYHTADGQILFLNGLIDNYLPTPLNHGILETAGASIVPLREEAGTINPTLGGISKILLRDRRLGIQQFRGFDSSEIICWYSFDRADFDRSLGTYGRHTDKSSNGNDLDHNASAGDPGEMINGPVNECLKLEGGALSVGTRWENTAITGHTSGQEISLSFWMRMDITPPDTVDKNYIELRDSGDVIKFRMYWDYSESEIVIEYGGTLHAQIPIAVFTDDNKMHLITVDDTYVYVDDNQYGGTTNTITGQITKVYIQGNDGTAPFNWSIDEFIVIDNVVTVSQGLYEHTPSFSDIPLLTTKHLKAEFEESTRSRWLDWDPSKLLLHAIFDEGTEDIGPYQHTITQLDGSYGFYKQGGFSRSRLAPASFSLGTDQVTLTDGFTVMWKGALTTTGSILDFDTTASAAAISIISTERTLTVNVYTASGTNTYTITGFLKDRLVRDSNTRRALVGVESGIQDNEYHEFWLTYRSDIGATLWVDGVKQTWDTTSGNYAEDAKLLTGTQSFGGSLVSDLVFITKVLETEKMGYLPQEEIFWKQYYRLSSAGDFGTPSAASITRKAAETIFGDRYHIRMEAGNPLVLIQDLELQFDDIYVHDQNSEWSVIAGRDILRDSRYGDFRNFGVEEAHKYFFALHHKTANGFGVFTGLDAKGKIKDARRAVVHVNAPSTNTDPITFDATNRAIVGFFNWPLWEYFRGAGDDVYALGGWVRGETTVGFHSEVASTAASQLLRWRFNSGEMGSYLVLLRRLAGTIDLTVGDPAFDVDGLFYETGISTTGITRVFNYNYGDLSDEGTEIQVQATSGASGDKVDYVGLLPLSNGLHFPLDFISQLLTQNG